MRCIVSTGDCMNAGIEAEAWVALDTYAHRDDTAKWRWQPRIRGCGAWARHWGALHFQCA